MVIAYSLHLQIKGKKKSLQFLFIFNIPTSSVFRDDTIDGSNNIVIILINRKIKFPQNFARYPHTDA